MKQLYDFIISRLCETSTWVGFAKIAGAYLAYRLVSADPANADAVLKRAVEILTALAAFGGAWNIVKPETKP